jgi:hypothetical protein
MGLHAWHLDIPHPLSGEKLALVAPLPEALGQFLVGLGQPEFAVPNLEPILAGRI